MSGKKMKILFFIGSLRGGGAERVVSRLANKFAEKDHQVTIVTKTPECVYTLHKDILWKPIFKTEDIKNSIFNKSTRRITYYPRLYNSIKKIKPDIILSFLVGMNRQAILISRILKIPIIVSDRISHKSDMTIFNWIERRVLYKYANNLVVLTEYDHNNYYSKFLKDVTVIPNPIYPSINENTPSREKIILAVGNLDRWYHKGFDNLIKAFSKISKKHPDWKLQIAGGGKKGKIYLQNIAKELGVVEKIDFMGFEKDVATIMQKSEIFILSSRFEGFPNVLVEAMSNGCTVIACDCMTGPREIIKNNIDGILIEEGNINEMSFNLNKLIADARLREELRKNSILNVKRFDIDYIYTKWNKLIINTLDKKGLFHDK